MRRRRSRTLVAAVVVALTMLLVGAPSRAVTWPWSVPTDVPGSVGGRDVLAAIDNDGVVTAAWTRSIASAPGTVVMATRREAGGDWTAAEPITDLNARAVGIDVGSDSTVSLLMRTRTGLFVTQWDRAGTWSSPELVAEGRRLRNPRLDASGGEPIVAWVSAETDTTRVLSVARRDDGSWTRPKVVSHANRRVADVELEVSATGTATLVWLQGPATGEGGKRVWLRKRQTDGSWGPRRALSAARAISLDLSVAEGGSTAVSWARFVGAGLRLVQVAYRNAGGRWTTDVVDEASERPYNITVLARPAGEAFVGWTYPAPDFGSRVWSAHRTKQGWSPPARVSPRYGGNSRPRFAVSGNGSNAQVWVVWSGNIDNPTNGNDYLVMSRLWRGDQWAITDAISSGHHNVGDLSVAIGSQQIAEEYGCALFSVYDPDLPGSSIQSSCLGAVA